MTIEEIRAYVIKALWSQSLADHLGDVRNSETYLWKALGATEDLPWDHPLSSPDPHDQYAYVAARLEHNGIELPEYIKIDTNEEGGAE